MTKHSTIVGGSTAGRILNCPASYQATLALPVSANVESEYAAEGTAMHQVMDILMRTRKIKASTDLYTLAEQMIGLSSSTGDRTLTREHVDTMIFPALSAMYDIQEVYDDGSTWEVAGVELEVQFPGVPGAFGTIDLILTNNTYVLHIDWKFGAGVPVQAVTRDELGEKVNAQLLFYVAAAMHSIKPLYKGKKQIVLAIVQPRSFEPFSHVVVSRKEVKWFVEDLQKAVEAATGRNPLMQRGEHCRFAPCKINCPKWTGPILELVALTEANDGNPADVSVSDQVTPYAEYLARCKALADIAAQFKTEVDNQLHSYLEAGGQVPGWRLKAKVKQRQWVDPEIVVPALEALGLTEDEIWQRKLQTFQVADAAARRHGATIPENLRIAPATTETTIAATDDPAPVVNRKLAVDQFRAAIEHISNSR